MRKKSRSFYELSNKANFLSFQKELEKNQPIPNQVSSSAFQRMRQVLQYIDI